MPCYQVNEFSIEFVAHNFGVLASAAKKLNATVQRNGSMATVVFADGTTITIKDGKADGVGAKAMEATNTLRLAYSQEIVNQAKRMLVEKGWQSQQTGKNTYTITKGAR